MNNQKGFALIELMAVIVLVGIIATFSAFFLRTGFNGYLNTKNTTEGALNAQMALDRISMELRNIRELTGTPSSTSLSYKSEDPTETRTLKYENQRVFIRVDTTDHMLLDNISSFTLSFATRDMDHIPPYDDELAGLRWNSGLKGYRPKFQDKYHTEKHG